MKHRFSEEQKAYIAALALLKISLKASRDNDKLIDNEAEKLGIPTPYAILPEAHPLMIRAQELLDQENAARKLMYEAAFNLFDWATETTLAKMGTATQKAEIRQMVVTVKTKSYVAWEFQKLVSLSMKLAA